MLSNAARFLMASAAASVVAFGSAPADACSDISDSAIDIITAGTYYSSGAVFFTAAQKEAFGYTGEHIKTLWGNTSPGSALYYDKLVAEIHTTSITDVNGIAAGDVLVIDSVTTTPTYSGHTVIITGPAIELTGLTDELEPLAPIYTNTKQWALPIADSTTSPHGCNDDYPDSRWSGPCSSTTPPTFTAGPGTAFVRLYTDATTGELKGHTWSVSSASTSAYYSTTARPFVIGRLNSCPPL